MDRGEKAFCGGRTTNGSADKTDKELKGVRDIYNSDRDICTEHERTRWGQRAKEPGVRRKEREGSP